MGQNPIPITKAQALRQAQLSLLRGESSTAAATDQRGLGIKMQPGIQRPTVGSTGSSFTPPYCGAPFVLIGMVCEKFLRSPMYFSWAGN